MTERRSASGLCVVVLLLLSGARFGGAQESQKGNNLQLPQGSGAWLLEMNREGGMRPARGSVSINSGGEVGVHAEHYAAGSTVVDCSIRVKIEAEDFLKLQRALRPSKPAAWRSGYSDKKHPICCDQPTLQLTLLRRDARGGISAFTTSWYPGSSKLRPADLTELASVVQELWNKASARCEAGE
ncbi:MAG TPA: hypothetical protein VD861_12820 [Pyrinomonadaceae bacterium]|jgi:hypothetical protein|nr:hypothetical protein [Pyrinomonadaceae bacterium]